jgi:D-lyxose ketol-isomerase
MSKAHLNNICSNLAVSALALALLAGCAHKKVCSCCCSARQEAAPSCYDASGKFDQEAAKRVYLDFLKRSDYPVNDTIAQKLYVTDFGLGRFTEAGLGVIVWWGDEKYNYSGLDAFLLPGQIIPEHWHVKVKDVPEKMEAWLVRSGEIYAYAEGAPTANIKARLAPADATNVTVKCEHILRVGDITGISHPLEKHWMQAGPQGAVFTEFSTYHTGEAVKFTDPRVKF